MTLKTLGQTNLIHLRYRYHRRHRGQQSQRIAPRCVHQSEQQPLPQIDHQAAPQSIHQLMQQTVPRLDDRPAPRLVQQLVQQQILRSDSPLNRRRLSLHRCNRLSDRPTTRRHRSHRTGSIRIHLLRNPASHRRHPSLSFPKASTHPTRRNTISIASTIRNTSMLRSMATTAVGSSKTIVAEERIRSRKSTSGEPTARKAVPFVKTMMTASIIRTINGEGNRVTIVRGLRRTNGATKSRLPMMDPRYISGNNSARKVVAFARCNRCIKLEMNYFLSSTETESSGFRNYQVSFLDAKFMNPFDRMTTMLVISIVVSNRTTCFERKTNSNEAVGKEIDFVTLA
mmetsp:Transcript_13169/g.30990  ORF Transcript_13169/g.30990 Transcript_13169/m.30990 type:complete len:341 (+) Transcript_13169:144-1166(+)